MRGDSPSTRGNGFRGKGGPRVCGSQERRQARARAPSGNAWTDSKLVHVFPELAPEELALNAMYRPVSGLWMALVRWLAEDPRRLDSYGPPMWNQSW